MKKPVEFSVTSEHHWYERFGIEHPFPWPAIFLLPIGWVIDQFRKALAPFRPAPLSERLLLGHRRTNPGAVLSVNVRDRLSQIASDNYEDEWGYPAYGTFDNIADAILEEFIVFKLYKPELSVTTQTTFADRSINVTPLR